MANYNYRINYAFGVIHRHQSFNSLKAIEDFLNDVRCPFPISYFKIYDKFGNLMCDLFSHTQPYILVLTRKKYFRLIKNTRYV